MSHVFRELEIGEINNGTRKDKVISENDYSDF